MWEIVKSMADNGTTVLLTTQYLDEAEYLADHIAILHESVIIAEGNSTALKDRLPQGILQLQFENEAELQSAIGLLDSYAIHKGEGKHAIDLRTDGSTKQFADVLNRLSQSGIEPKKFTQKQPTLEDAFLTLIGEKQEDTNHDA